MTTTKPTRIFNRAETVITSDIYMLGSVGEAEHYIEDMQVMRECGPNDKVNIYLNNTGGLVSTANQYINVMAQCPGEVITHIEGECHSAATYIFLSSDSWVVHPNTRMLIHNYSGGTAGKGKDIVQSAKEDEAWVQGLMDRVYLDTGFLTKEELDSVKNNQDIWLNSTQIEERLERVVLTKQNSEKVLDNTP